MSLFAELKRRNVFRVGIAYIVVAWLLLQVVDVVVPLLALPDWVGRFFFLLLVVGFVLALVFAWAFELTPDGLKRDSEAARQASEANRTSRKLDLLIIGVLVVAVAWLLVDRLGGGKPGELQVSTAPAVQQGKASVDIAADDRKAIAVLPFENLSADAENAYFAAGVHEDILTYLSRIAGLRVNSRTSVQQYADVQVNLKEVAAALGAVYIVEGSVRRAGNRVRVTAQLIDARTDEHLWAENFDRELTDIFAIQTAVAQDIVDALQEKLSPREASMLASQPTNSIAAYDHFLKARTLLQDNGLYMGDTAVRELEQALDLDPGYAQAWALLAVAHGEQYWFMNDRSAERLERMKAAVERALELDPDLPEGHLALALYHYRGFYDYAAALEQLQLAEALIPNDPFVHSNLGLTLRRLGEYERSVEAFLKAASLEPSVADYWGEALETAVSSRNTRRALEIDAMIPDRLAASGRIVGQRALMAIFSLEDIAAAREQLVLLPDSDNYYYFMAGYYVAMLERDFETAARIAAHPDFMEQIAYGWGRTEAALALELGGLTDEARALRIEADAIISAEVAKPYAATYAWPHYAHARNLVRLGRPEEALASCARVREILPVTKDKVHGVELQHGCSWVKAQAGLVDEALDEMETVIHLWGDTAWYYANAPEWEFLRGNQRFEALLSRGNDNLGSE